MGLEHLNENRVERAMCVLAETDMQAADAKVMVLRTEQKIKTVKALVYAALEGSIEDKKQKVELHEDVKAAWEDYFKAVRDYELVKNKREREVLIVELFRSVNANRRLGQMS